MAGLRLLLIDDDEPTRKYIRRVAEEAGYDVFDTDNARTFVEAYEAGSFDLIVTDLVMPQMDGLEILSLLSERQCRTPILLISGYRQKLLESAQRLGTARGLSIIGTLGKPIRSADLRAALQKKCCRGEAGSGNADGLSGANGREQS